MGETEQKNFLFDDEQRQIHFEKNSIKKFRSKQIDQAIFKEAILDIDEITTIPKDLRSSLAESFVINSFELIECVEGPETTKFLFQLPDGKVIETVLMFHRHVKDEYKDTLRQRKILRSRTKPKISPETHKLNRITICISSQVGCAVGCIFCVTGKMGFKKNLGRQEIILQIIYANSYIKEKFGKKEDGTRRRVRNVVFMGMGEPLLNYDNVEKSIEVMLDQKKLGLSKRHITISTSGVADKIELLVERNIDVRLALSLHAPNQDLRLKLIPMIARRRPIDELMRIIDMYTRAMGRGIFYEYIMIHNTTDTDEIAHQLGVLLSGRDGHLNLIPYNENPAMPDLETSEYERILAFKNVVQSYNVKVTVRDTLGRDVKGACGQLGYEVVMKQRIDDMTAEEEESKEKSV